MNTQWLTLLMLSSSLAFPARAADTDADTDKDNTGKPPVTETNKGTDMQADKLAAEFKIPESEVLSLRAKGLGWGEIRNALAISQKAGVPVSDVLKLRSEHMGWGKVSQHYGFKLGDVAGRAEERREIRRDRDDRHDRHDRDSDRHEHGEMHEHAGGGPHGRG